MSTRGREKPVKLSIKLELITWRQPLKRETYAIKFCLLKTVRRRKDIEIGALRTLSKWDWAAQNDQI